MVKSTSDLTPGKHILKISLKKSVLFVQYECV